MPLLVVQGRAGGNGGLAPQMLANHFEDQLKDTWRRVAGLAEIIAEGLPARIPDGDQKTERKPAKLDRTEDDEAYQSLRVCASYGG